MRKILLKMITTNIGGISSKIVVGSLSYIITTIVLLVLAFVNPAFPGLSDLITIQLITSASLLGLTTVENIKQVFKSKGKLEKKKE